MWCYVIRGVIEISEMCNKNVCIVYVFIMIFVNFEFLSIIMFIFDELFMYIEMYCDC